MLSKARKDPRSSYIVRPSSIVCRLSFKTEGCDHSKLHTYDSQPETTRLGKSRRRMRGAMTMTGMAPERKPRLLPLSAFGTHRARPPNKYSYGALRRNACAKSLGPTEGRLQRYAA